jgi:tripartite-type tricarboxylate transporter receptor subunit TctC
MRFFHPPFAIRHSPWQLAAALALVAASAPAIAQGDAAKKFPTKPIRIVVGYAAGGGNDIIVRVLTPKLSEILGQTVIVDNRPGAQSIIAADMVAKANPDGYTLLMGPSGPMTMNPAIYSKLPYSPLGDFAPITMIGSFPLILVVSPSLPVKSVKELVAHAQANPDKVSYGSSAAAFQLTTELFNQRTSTRFLHVPYKGVNESVNAVVAGQVTMTIGDPAPIVGLMKSGRVRALAVTSAKRHPQWPDLPTLGEAGVPNIEVTLWTGFQAPVKTPRAVVRKLRDEVARVVHLPEIKERFAVMAIEPSGNTSEEFSRIIAADIQKWTAVAKAANIKAD